MRIEEQLLKPLAKQMNYEDEMVKDFMSELILFGNTIKCTLDSEMIQDSEDFGLWSAELYKLAESFNYKLMIVLL